MEKNELSDDMLLSALYMGSEVPSDDMLPPKLCMEDELLSADRDMLQP
jgi:hypothetical protein